MAVWLCFCTKGLFGKKNLGLGMLPYFDPMKRPDFGTYFWLEKEGILTSVLHRNCSCNCELDVRLLNHQIGPLYLK